MSVPAYAVDDAARARAREVGARVRHFVAARVVEGTALARLHAWLRYGAVYHCNALEGPGLTETETKAVLVDGMTVGKPLRDHLWAVNVSVANERIERWMQEPGAITEAMILELNAILLRAIDELGAGSYRRVAVYVTGADFEPPPPEEVPARMQELCAWLAAPTEQDPIVFAAFMHAWFETIHPFVDGNGRAGRLLIDLGLGKRGYLRALIRAESRERYRQALACAQAALDLSPLVMLVADSAAQLLDEHERATPRQQNDNSTEPS
jgi:Fic family protein